MYISKRNKIYNDSKLPERSTGLDLWSTWNTFTCENGHTTELDRREKIFFLLVSLLKVPHNRHLQSLNVV